MKIFVLIGLVLSLGGAFCGNFSTREKEGMYDTFGTSYGVIKGWYEK